MNWSEHIPLVTLIAVVFSAGVLYAQHSGLKRELRTLIDKTIPRMHKRIDEQGKDLDWLLGALGKRLRVNTSPRGISTEDETPNE